jgi:hypothetical protein
MASVTRIRLRIAGPALLLIAGVLLYSGISNAMESGRLASEGVEVPGKLVNHRVDSGRRGSKSYHIAVMYQPKGSTTPVQKEFFVSKSTFDRTPDGGAINIRHLPSDPQVSEISGDGETGIGKLLFGGFLLLFGGFIAYAGYSKEN